MSAKMFWQIVALIIIASLVMSTTRYATKYLYKSYDKEHHMGKMQKGPMQK